jgi:ABC-type nitrate/sulfonate/bicarbonate transport system permease component
MIHENIGYLIINSFYSIDSSLYPAGLYLAIVYAYLVGLLLYVSEQFLHQRVSALKIKTAKAPNSLP